MRLILASTSPRRREILALLGLRFEMIAPDFNERISPDAPAEKEVAAFALGKATSVAALHPDGIVVGSDTMIVIGARKIGKPDSIVDAKRLLRALSGRTHRILTSVAIIDGLGGAGLRAGEDVLVRMRAYSDEEIDRYLSCGESLDKAAAYSIQGQGSALIESIEGDYLAAVGLPLKPIARYLKGRGIFIPLDIEKLYAEKSYMNWSSF